MQYTFLQIRTTQRSSIIPLHLQKDDCKDLIQQTSLTGGQVDFLDPTEFVGAEKASDSLYHTIEAF